MQGPAMSAPVVSEWRDAIVECRWLTLQETQKSQGTFLGQAGIVLGPGPQGGYRPCHVP